MSKEFVHVASSLDRDSLERLQAYLALHGLDCQVTKDPQGGAKAALTVWKDQLDQAQKVLDELVLAGDPDSAGDDIEFELSGEESTQIASWLQMLLDDHDRDGTPIYFYRRRYEESLDQLRGEGRLVMPVFLMKNLRPFLPQPEQRILMARPLQEFFHVVEAVANESD